MFPDPPKKAENKNKRNPGLCVSLSLFRSFLTCFTWPEPLEARPAGKRAMAVDILGSVRDLTVLVSIQPTPGVSPTHRISRFRSGKAGGRLLRPSLPRVEDCSEGSGRLPGIPWPLPAALPRPEARATAPGAGPSGITLHSRVPAGQSAFRPPRDDASGAPRGPSVGLLNK